MEKLMLKVASIITAIFIISATIVLYQTYDFGTPNNNVSGVISDTNISAKTAYPYAAAVAHNWSSDALMSLCRSNECTQDGNSSAWHFEFFSPSSFVYSNETGTNINGDEYTYMAINCNYLTLEVYINGTITNISQNKYFAMNYPKEFSNWIMDSNEIYTIARNNESICERIDNQEKYFNGTAWITFQASSNSTCAIVYFSEYTIHNTPDEPHVWFTDSIWCEISHENGNILDISFWE